MEFCLIWCLEQQHPMAGMPMPAAEDWGHPHHPIHSTSTAVHAATKLPEQPQLKNNLTGEKWFISSWISTLIFFPPIALQLPVLAKL